jgi:protein-tyrosine phosphatase
MMIPVIYKVGNIGSGWFAIMGRPRAGEWAEDEFSGLARLGVTDVVSLLEAAEARDLDLQHEAQLCRAAGIKFFSFPIPDRGVPPSAVELGQFAWGVYHQIALGRAFAIHCRAGIGRSSLVAAALLLRCGKTPDQAFSQISISRGMPVPDTPQQAQWLAANQSVIALNEHPGRDSGHG